MPSLESDYESEGRVFEPCPGRVFCPFAQALSMHTLHVRLYLLWQNNNVTKPSLACTMWSY